MFKSIGTTLVTGFITVLPIVLTIYLLYWLVVSSEQVMGSAFRHVLPGIQYFPGLGSIVGLILVFFIGLLMKAVLVRKLFSFGEQILYHLPIIKTVYRAIRDFFDFFSPKKEHFGRVVIVKFGEMEIIGFVTQEDPERLPQVGNAADATAKKMMANHQAFSYIKSEDGHVFTASVGRFQPNGFGLYDMHGNVHEWCSDCFDRNYYSKSPKVDPAGPENGLARALRGGDWGSDDWYCRCAIRSLSSPERRSPRVGFRVVMKKK